MSRGFGSTFGAGTSDTLVTQLVDSSLVTFSISAWIWVNGLGGGNVGRVISARSNNNGTAGFLLSVRTTTTTMRFGQYWNSTLAHWSFPIPAATPWQHVCVTYDGSSSANKPVCYANGVSQIVTVIAGPTGSITHSGLPINIGDDPANAGGTNNAWDGMLAHIAVWNNKILSDGEILSLASGVPSLLISPETLTTYLPLNGVNNPESDLILGNSSAITGTKFGASDPPVNPCIASYGTFNTFMNSNFIYINPKPTPAPPPPTNLPYVIGTGMVQQGTSILLQGTAPLINKGTVRDQQNIIPH